MNTSTVDREPDRTDIDAVLRRYLDIQKQEQSLKDEKATLQAVLAEHMSGIGRNLWYPEIDGRKLKVRCSESVVVDYNEGLLRDRLAERYSTILEPDLKKIRKALGDVAPLLQPVMDRIGSPSADKVRCAIETGSVRKEEFVGAFKKTTKRIVAVGRLRDRDVAS